MIQDQYLSNVFSNMNLAPRIMAVGQNPGRDEVEQKEPFVGVSGKFFNNAVLRVGLSRSDFYISNVVRCLTPSNRPPNQGELDNCRSFLDREVVLVKPKLIVALGSLAFRQLTGMKGIVKYQGRAILSLRYHIPIVPILHPSPLNTNVPEKCKMFMDGLVFAKECIDALDAGKECPGMG